MSKVATLKNSTKPANGKELNQTLKLQEASSLMKQLQLAKPVRKQVEGPVVNLLDLPERVRVKILGYLSRAERATAQLVCRKFRNEMRMRVGLQSRVTDSSKNGLVFMRDVIVDSIIVGRFLQPSLTPLQIIGHPDTVTQLVFEEPLSIPYLDAFLSRCSRVVNVVVAAPILDGLSFPRLNQPKSGVSTDSFRSLDTILKSPVQLERLRDLSLILPGRKSLSFVQKLLTVITGPNLEKLSVRIGGDKDKVDTYAIHSRILIILQKSNKSLTHLLISTQPTRIDTKVPDCGNLISFPKSAILELSLSLQLKALVLTETCINYQMWSIFISKQKELETFQVMHTLTLKIIKPVFQMNARTLRKIGVHVQLWQKDAQLVPLNMSLFSECELLEELMVDISIETSGKREDGDPGIPNVILLRELPKSIRVLCLRNCAFLTLDLLQMRQNHHNISSLGLVSMPDVNRFPGFGVSYHALLHLFRYPGLNEILVTEMRTSERDKHSLRRIKKMMESGFKQNRNGFYLGPIDKDKCRWVIGPNNSCFFRFATTWGISKTEI